MTTYALRSASPAKTRADCVVAGAVATEHGPRLAAGADDVAAAYGRKLRPLLAMLGVTGQPGESVAIATNGTIRSPLLVLVGLGSADTDPVAVRRAAGVAARSVPNASSVALALPAGAPALVRAVTEGYLLGGYRFTGYRRDSYREPSAAGTVIVLASSARQGDAQAAFEQAQVLARGVATTRDWVNTPAGDFTPPIFADAVAAAHREVVKGRTPPSIELRIRDEDELATAGCGGILAVGRSSAAPPMLVELRYRPPDPTARVALVGKGVTYDSGGLHLKPATSLPLMKCDMAGAAIVVQATLVAATLRLPVAVSAFAPMAENMISGSAMRPGDVITMSDGRTVEITDSDAEGRLLLADALGLALAEGADTIIDVATLTGQVKQALGDHVGGVMGQPETVAAVVTAAETAGESLWPLPIPEEMSERITSSRVADLSQHDGVRWGGGSYAAAFLREFTGARPWAHLDIYGPSLHHGAASGFHAPGATGFGVATLVDYLRSLS